MINYQKLEKENYNIHVIKSKKFKTITLKINFKRQLIKDEITIRNMLVNMLFASTKKYPTKRLLEIETENLYGISYRGTNYKSGIYSVMSFDLTFLNEKYTEENMNYKSIDFFEEILLNPNVSNGLFTEKDFKIAYNILHDEIISLKENTATYSQIRMLENMEDSVISYRGCGYLEDLEKVNTKNLYDYYQDMLKSDVVDIFILGDFDDDLVEYINDKFKIGSRKSELKSHFYKHDEFRNDINEVVEETDTTQSKLIIGFKLNNLTDFELRYVLNIYNYILGGSPDSKLFKNIREKNSLCYSISSHNLPLIGLFTIQSGINKDDFNKTYELILKEIKDMENGIFEENDINNGITTYINSLEELKDSPGSIISLYAGCEYLNSESIENRILNIKKVTKEDIINLTKKIKLDTVYLLKGTLDEEDVD